MIQIKNRSFLDSILIQNRFFRLDSSQKWLFQTRFKSELDVADSIEIEKSIFLDSIQV